MRSHINDAGNPTNGRISRNQQESGLERKKRLFIGPLSAFLGTSSYGLAPQYLRSLVTMQLAEDKG
jgi:hypothetical protein